MSQTMNPKPSMFSLISNNGTPGATTMKQVSGQGRFGTSNRPCTNCTCSPGLLSRQGRRSSVYLKRININRTNSLKANQTAGTSPGLSPRRRTGDSLYTIDSKCSTKEINTSLRLEKLRVEMKLHDIAIYIIPSADAHQSEYTSAPDQRRAFISGFGGSSGVAVVTRDVTCMNETPEGLSALATDGRYFIQAANELDFNWQLLKQGVPGDPSWEEWTVEQAIQMARDSGETIKIGVDPTLFTYSEIKTLESLVSQKNTDKVKIVPVRENLIDKIWSLFEEMPLRQFNEIIPLGLEYTGESTQSKMERLQLYFNKYGSSTLILSALDQIAWLLNLRGKDIDFNPLFYSYLIIEKDKLTLYTNGSAVTSDTLKSYLQSINCEVKNYEDIWSDIRKLASELNSQGAKILLTKEASWKMVNCIIAKNFLEIDSPIAEMKEVKNEVELKNQKNAQIKDGMALIKYFAWLEDQLINKDEFVSEYEGGMKLLEFRSQLDNFKGLSFETISSTGSNAAIIHYAPKRETSTIINPNKIYLCDSGAQFLDGTTDTTRTLHFKTPTEEETRNYTLVLKGHIALAKLVFPQGYTGYQVDSIARQFLWQHGLDYEHGTGHGVDSYGPVHSMGVGIGYRPQYNSTPLTPGHLISNEPGYYKPGEYGIRIENMFFVKKSDKMSPGGKQFLEFETVTTVPYCRRLIDVKLLSPEEKQYINDYHQKIWQLYESRLPKKSLEYNWLKKECKPL
ncbi:hypothetical protein KL921_000068 [Ogataea angusta]|uniref:Xaa-Pro aminopeptidase n=1 Tax=Pichia angusta TaxID=870730 RepID=A0AAN6I8I6_PICAN|nr:uncharacterized protein KL928_000724 [Ogataea angusta]KAG7813794.1 hypothetical protein KL921_000068 [Ogataea angusta]KAG7822249.1 hypothetical protein KL928_000724 [Ogataea angusta]KAG7825477.1 hypothetical protein KL909_000709 [Ogataea angusta]KAG7831597.1 hypothetical protein KL920_001117 [Ogataea angusta]KAG7832375.1 hypothetical protein KL943_005033 [Ogataea angusta]